MYFHLQMKIQFIYYLSKAFNSVLQPLEETNKFSRKKKPTTLLSLYNHKFATS